VSTRDELLEAALRYRSAGWPVFRCQPGKKIPVDGSAGFKDATTDLAKIRAWWRSDPYNVAIPTGTATADVLDVDVKPDGSGWAAFSRLKRSGLLAGARAMVRTRSGGLHVYFAGTDQPCGRLPRHHLDFKASGGYVLVSPSFVDADDKGPAGAYELLDHRPGGGARLDWEAVRQLLEPRRSIRQRRPDSADSARLVEWVARQNKPGDRHDPLKWAAFRLLEAGQLDDAVAADLVSASVAAGHDEADARRTVQSIRRKAER
jgi:hypothetical protein